MIPIFLAKVENGKMRLEKPDEFSLWLNQFIGKIVEITVKAKRRPRTTGKIDEAGNQNGYYWCVVIPISAKFTGYTDKEMHEIFTEQFAPYTVKEFNGKQIKSRIRTSEMNTIQMSEYTESCRMAMAELNCIIPDPQKQI